MRKWLLAAALIGMVAVTGCSRFRAASEQPQPETQDSGTDETLTIENETEAETEPAAPQRERVKVKGIYISGFMAGSEGLTAILDKVEQSEINAVVIDVKNDEGRITYAMDSPTVNEVGASVKYIQDIDGLMKELKSRNLYTIARVVAFRDPYLAEKKPEWSLKNADGSLHRDKQGLAWVNPYKQEVWDYLVEVGTKAAAVGFDEIQFDYIRFSTDGTMKDVAFDEADTRGRSKTDVITEFITYAYDRLSAENVYVAADVFGTIIGSRIDADAVGQVYNDMAKHLDYICPMIYPSHYGDGNFGIEHPDTQPYDTILAALHKSRQDLASGKVEGVEQAIVRPWLQDFTASYLKNYIKYGPDEIRAQIQAVYDAGYDEWILWSASNKYTWDGLLTPEAAAEEEMRIAESRAALPPETTAAPAVPAESDSGASDDASQAASGEPATTSQNANGEQQSGEGKKAAAGNDDGESKASPENPSGDAKEKKPSVVIITTDAAGEFK